jgi:hypothetical protein
MGGFAFTMAFFRSMRYHDYYQICNLMFIPFIYLGILKHLKDYSPKIFHSLITMIVLGIGMVFLIQNCKNNMDFRYSMKDANYVWSKNNLEMYGELTPYLRSLGIERTDIVYCSPDPSINISLYLMDQKGFTDFVHAWRNMNFDEKYNTMKEAGLKYVIIGDTTGFAQRNNIHFSSVNFGKQIGQFGKARIYDISKNKE